MNNVVINSDLNGKCIDLGFEKDSSKLTIF